jgi:glycosyltransferase involved in cell wall biosynthesis/predicted metal-dependent phosphoesterase TrpH
MKTPECFTPPELVYSIARRRGMDLVTITDINTIDGCLEISDLPGVFISEEVSTRLPESRKLVHLLVYDLTPEHHQEICILRRNFFELVVYLKEEKLLHSMAHPFFFPGEELTPREFARVVKCLDVVETLNGTRSIYENNAVASVVRAAREDPSFCCFTGGSDDHCSRFIGLTYTSVEGANDIREFLEGIRQGKGLPEGQNGNAVRAAYSIYSISYSFYRDRFSQKKVPAMASLVADRFFHPSVADVKPTVWHKAEFFLHQMLKCVRHSDELDFEAFLIRELMEIGKDLNLSPKNPALAHEGIDEKTFEILNRLTNKLLQHYLPLLLKRICDGKLLDAMEAFTALIPVVLLNFPYPIAHLDRKRGRDAMETISGRIVGSNTCGRSREKRAWITDTIDDLNGVSRTLQKLSSIAVSAGRQLALITCQSRPLSFPGWVVNFAPLLEFPIPGYHAKLLSVPPFLEMLRFIDENDFGMLYISTPGPLGVAALAIGKLLGIPTVAIYHTDFPRHINQIVQDARIGDFAVSAMSWFYGSVDRILVPSEFYIDDLVSMGVPGEKMAIFPRGTDSDRFSPVWHNSSTLLKYGGRAETVKLLYVGRISVEKDLDVLAEAFLRLSETRDDLELYFAGNGPYLPELRRILKGSGTYFCGVLSDEELYRVYASGDIFIFPSTTDTFGNSVLEAQSSGLPAIVTNLGGPQEIIVPGRSGLVYSGRDVEDLMGAIVGLADNTELRRSMSVEARKVGLSRSWSAALETIWSAPFIIGDDSKPWVMTPPGRTASLTRHEIPLQTADLCPDSVI